MATNSASRRWVLADPDPECANIGLHLGLPTSVVQVLVNRGIDTSELIATFLSPDGGPIHDPALLPDIEAALHRLLQAAGSAETVAVYGDYDADGVTGCALLTEVLQGLGCQVIPYIPERAAEGYGLNLGAVAYLVKQGVSLLVAVDCGSSDRKEIATAQENGLDVIVIDHHEVPDDPPTPLALVNPRRSDSVYPFPYLAAVGVAFKVASGLLAAAGYGPEEREERERRLLDLVALGTVADVAPLLDENRALVKKGLRVLNSTGRVGLQRLYIQAGVRQGSIDAKSIGYGLGPRLNAPGRMRERHAEEALRLLLTRDRSEADQLASDLEAANRERHALLQEAVRSARAEVLQAGDVPAVLLVSGEQYQSGIVGLIASRLVEEFYRPAIVIEQGEPESRGSCRSIAEFHITEALTGCREMLSRYGGHAQAAGFSIVTERLEEFRLAMLAAAEAALGGLELAPSIRVDAQLSLAEADFPFYQKLASLAPFGHGNPSPIFLTRGVTVKEARPVGQSTPNHLKLRLSDGDKLWSGIAFGRGAEASQMPYGTRIDVVYAIIENHYNGLVSLELQVQDWRPA